MKLKTRLLPTSVVGSYSQPGWYAHCIEGARNGAFGPVDVEEFFNDAVDMAIRDQEDAGVDVISDGEMRRVGLGFFTAAFYRHIPGLEAIEAGRKLGAAGHDQQHKFRATKKISAPHGLGSLAEWQYASRRATAPVKVLLPGPFTLAGRIVRGSGEKYKTREEVAWDFVEILHREIQSLVDAGVPFIQIDEPSPAIHPGDKAPFAKMLNACLKGVKGLSKVKIASHLCFGNNLGRAVSKRQYAPVIDEILKFNVDQLLLEFANRELDEIEICGEIAKHKEIAAGLLDVKNYYIETPQDIAERIRIALKFVPAEKLWIIPDCGFSETARWVSRRKLMAMAEGARIVREELTGVKEPSRFDVKDRVEVSQTHAQVVTFAAGKNKTGGGSCC
jgi:5-methyltetrahydropteroyltriglutamate--homocysteine methyltransferase